MHAPPRCPGAAGILLLAAVLLVGCASGEKDEDAAAAAREAAAIAEDSMSAGELVDLKYIIARSKSHSLRYRIDWQHASSGYPIKDFVQTGDSVFTLDTANNLTRFRHAEGDRVWRRAVANPVVRIFGITYVEERNRVFLMTGSEVLELDAETGALVTKQKLSQVANTAPVLFGSMLVYGSRSGQVVWHSYELATIWRAYQVAPSIQVAPVTSDGFIVAVGSDGRIMNLNGKRATQVWRRRALSSIVADPAIGDGVVYVASNDQHLRAYDLRQSRSPLWEYLTESPLTEAPTLIGDHVYQFVPTEGLVCLEAQPLDSPGGRVVWRNPECTGNVLTRLGDELITWDAERQLAAVVDVRTGSTADTLHLPRVADASATDVLAGNIYLIGVDGRFLRLVKRN
ncbi:MAG: PQQ-binding-like beta-propeller repeat protein [Planctomycetes bacterium]|nr:PQQ-binding-like beta-propeller repeat protein [Planctomycetota bacterium]